MIDTANIYYKNLQKKETIKHHFISNVSAHSSGKGWYAQIKPSKLYLGNDTSTIKELLSTKDCLDIISEEEGIITRIDLVYDLESLLKDNIKLYKLYVSCMALLRGGDIKNIYTTSTQSPKNLKTKNRTQILTIYDCSDKLNRKGNTRIENRISKLMISSNYENKIKIHIKEYIIELNTASKMIGEVETKYVELLKNDWARLERDMGKLHEFITVNNEKVLTRNILVEFLKAIQYPNNIDNFVDRHCRKKDRDPFNFVTKTSFLQLIKNIKNDMKKTSQFWQKILPFKAGFSSKFELKKL